MKSLFLLDFKGLWKGLRYFYLALVIFNILYVINAVVDHSVLGFITEFISAFVFNGFSLALLLYHGVHYYRTMIGSQATLYHSLPVTKAQLIRSKILAFVSHHLIFICLAFTIPFLLYFFAGKVGFIGSPAHLEMTLQDGSREAEEILQTVQSMLAQVTVTEWVIFGLQILLLLVFGIVGIALFIQTVLQVQADARFQKRGVGASVATAFVVLGAELLILILFVFAIVYLFFYTDLGLGFSIMQYVHLGQLFYLLLIIFIDVLLYSFNLKSMNKYLSI